MGGKTACENIKIGIMLANFQYRQSIQSQQRQWQKVKTKSLEKFLKLLEASLKPYPVKSMKTLENQVREHEVCILSIPISKKMGDCPGF